MAGLQPEGTLIAYATADDNVAEDNPAERNGLYTKHLIEALRTQDADLRLAFQLAREQTFLASNRQQNPFTYDGVVGQLFLSDRRTLTPQPPPAVIDNRPQVGDVRTNPKDGQRYAWVPPGTFRMGCSEGYKECHGDENPARDVTLFKGIWMGQTEVTVDAYKRFASSAGRSMPAEPVFRDRKLNANWTQGNMPMVNVDWNDAKSYCEWAGARLPTEAEWERAGRGGGTAARYGMLGDVAWFGDNSGKEAIDSQRIWDEKPNAKDYNDKLYPNENRFHPVAMKAPNGYALYDMLGNVLEWTSDWYGEKYYAGGERRDPQGPLAAAVRDKLGLVIAGETGHE